MAKIAAPTLRSIRSSPAHHSRAPRKNPAPRPRASVENVGDTPVSLRTAQGALNGALEDILTGLMVHLELLDEGELTPRNVRSTSRLALMYLDLWTGMYTSSEAAWTNDDVNDARAILVKPHSDGVDEEILHEDGLKTHYLRHACAECLVWNAEYITSGSARSLVYLEAVRAALPWRPEINDHIVDSIRWLWKNVDGVVAVQTGFHCAYQFGIDVIEQRQQKLTARWGKRANSVVATFNEQMYSLLDGGQDQRLMEELNADTREYLGRNETEEEQVKCSVSYESSKQEAVGFVNATIQGNTVVFDRIKPF